MENLSFSSLLETLGRSSAQAGVLVVFVLIGQWLGRHHLPPRWRSALWLLVVARLLLPFSFGTAISLFNYVPRMAAVRLVTPSDSLLIQKKEETPPMAYPAHGSQPIAAPEQLLTLPPLDRATAQFSQASRAPASAPVTVPSKTLSHRAWIQIIGWVWLGGIVLLVSLLTVSTIRLHRWFGRSAPSDSPRLAELLDTCRQHLHVRTKVALVESPHLTTPALYGVFRPRLLLPNGFRTRFSEQEIRFIFLHELAHLRRHDLALNWLMTGLQIVHWFNPLLWLGFHRWRADRELACDAIALEAAGSEQNYDYGRTILRVLEGFTTRMAAPGLVGILEDKRQLRQRLLMIAAFRPGKRLGFVTTAVLVLLGFVCLTDAQAPKTKTAAIGKLDAAGASQAEESAQPNSSARVVPLLRIPAPPKEARKEQPATNPVRVGTDPKDTATFNLPMQTLSLLILDQESGRPVSDALVIPPFLDGEKKPSIQRRTDQDGRYLLRVPLPPEEVRGRMGVFSVSIQHPDYASRALGWTRSPGDVYKMLPETATLRLQKGVTIGGTVRDAQGQPLAGVKVLLYGSGYRGYSMGTQDEKTHEYPEIWRADTAAPAATTDSQGRWTFANFPPDLNALELTFVRPDDSRTKFSTSPGFNNVNQFAPASLTALLAGNASFVLPDGVAVRGVVVDSAGRPVPGARVKEGYGHGNIELVSEFITGPDGRFERLHRVPRQWIYTASAEGKATVSAIATVTAAMPEVRLVLPPALPLRLRVTDAQGQPLRDCPIRLETYRNEGQILDWTATTDRDGRATWAAAPTQEIQFTVQDLKGGVYRKFRALANGQEKVLVLSKPTSVAAIRIEAKDRITRQPVAIDAVSAEFNGAFQFQKLAEPKQAECTVEVRSSNFQVGMGESYTLKVETSGYEAYVVENIDLAEGDQEIHADLVKVVPIEGVIRLADGAPAAGARIWVQGTRNSGALFSNEPGKYYGDRLEKTQVDANGKYRLRALAGNPPLVITHPSGLLETTLDELKKQPEILLPAWSRVQGRLLVRGQPKGGVRVNLATLNWAPSKGMTLSYSTETDPDGGFEFQRVPAGEYKLYRQPVVRIGRSITEDHPMPLTVRPGEDKKLDYQESGREVIGQATPDIPGMLVDWHSDDHVLALKQPAAPPVNREDYATFKDFLAANHDHYNSPTFTQQAREARTYILAFERDGSFRVDDVRPGTYELRIRVTKTDARNPYGAIDRPENQIASLVEEVVIPEGTGPVDLGTLTVQVNPTLKQPEAAPIAWQVTTLENRSLQASDFRGKHLALVLWANWSQRSKEQLAALKPLYEEFAANPRFALVNVCLDGELGKVKAAAETGGYPGITTAADKAQRVQLTKALEIEKLPMILLFDDHSRLIGRDFDAERLQTTLRRLLGKQQARK